MHACTPACISISSSMSAVHLKQHVLWYIFLKFFQTTQAWHGYFFTRFMIVYFFFQSVIWFLQLFSWLFILFFCHWYSFFCNTLQTFFCLLYYFKVYTVTTLTPLPCLSTFYSLFYDFLVGFSVSYTSRAVCWASAYRYWPKICRVINTYVQVD